MTKKKQKTKLLPYSFSLLAIGLGYNLLISLFHFKKKDYVPFNSKSLTKMRKNIFLEMVVLEL